VTTFKRRQDVKYLMYCRIAEGSPSRTAVAKRLEVVGGVKMDHRRYGHIESGKSAATPIECRAIAAMYGRMVEELFDKDGNAIDTVTHLKVLRDVLDLSTDEFACRFGMNLGRYSGIETCDVVASPDEQKRLVKALEASHEELFDERGYAKPEADVRRERAERAKAVA
jgi:transcriptional regulator with XRE-family HTH domain